MHTFATIEEVLDSYASLSSDQMATIFRAAARYIHGSRFTEPLDLIHETLTLVLEGRRHWPMHIDFGVFLFETMRSVASSDRALSENALRASVAVEDILDRVDIPRLQTPSVEDQLLALEPGRLVIQYAMEARAELGGDIDAQHVIDGLVAGLSPKETCDEFGVDPKKFEGARKRAIRKIKSIAPSKIH